MFILCAEVEVYFTRPIDISVIWLGRLHKLFDILVANHWFCQHAFNMNIFYGYNKKIVVKFRYKIFEKYL